MTDEGVHVSRGQLTLFLFLVFLTTLLVSSGVGWFVSGLAYSHANSENQKTLELVRMQGREGLHSLYLSEKARCANSTATRKVLATNARQAQRWYAYLSRTNWQNPELLSHLPKIELPPPIPPCKVTIEDPLHPRPVNKLGHPVRTD